jgi:hypothetical protein
MTKNFLNKILDSPAPTRGVHWVERLTKEEQVNLTAIWNAHQSGKTNLPVALLAKRIKEEIPRIKVQSKQIALWLRDPEGLLRCTKV